MSRCETSGLQLHARTAASGAAAARPIAAASKDSREKLAPPIRRGRMVVQGGLRESKCHMKGWLQIQRGGRGSSISAELTGARPKQLVCMPQLIIISYDTYHDYKDTHPKGLGPRELR
mgnify:CR=1 FL=1